MFKSNKIYMAYGSNMNVEQMADRCPYAVPLGTAVLEGYTLLFRGSKDHSVATIELDENESVPVLLWEITPRCEESLDRYEGFPSFYRKEIFPIQFNGKPIDTMVYIMNDGENLSSPSHFYLSIIYDSYLNVGFDPHILDKAVQNSSGLCLDDYSLNPINMEEDVE